MNVRQIIDIVKKTAIQQEPIKSVYADDVYTSWNSGEVKYGSFNIGLETANYEGQQIRYSFVLYYGDRLLQDKSNVHEIYSDGITAIQSVINKLNERMDVDIEETVQYQFFQQRFFDYLAGVYCKVDIMTDSELGLCGINDFETYTVTYVGNGGEGTVIDPNSPYQSGTNVTILDNAYTKEGYTFNGWNTESGGTGTEYAAGSKFCITGNTTFYAQWREYQNCTLTYVGNGGEGTMVDPNSPYEVGDTVTVLDNSYTYSGYTFDGWNTAADGSGTEFTTGSTFTITGNTVLYAQWDEIPALIVTYSGNGGDGTLVDPNSPYKTGAIVTILDNSYTKEHYTFEGWNTAADGSGVGYEAGNTFTITGSTTLYAQWLELPKYNVVYVGNGGSGTVVDTNSPYYVGSTVTILDNAYSREHYDFEGWNTESDGTGTEYATGSTFTITGNTTLYAQWLEHPKYNVVYVGNGGEGTMTDSNSPYYVGSTVTILDNTYTKEHYTFDSWNTAADGSGTEYSTGGTFTITGNTTLYAQWLEDPKYNVVYVGNGGEGTVVDSNSPYYIGSTVTVLANSYSRPFYEFTGWNTESGGTGTEYTTGDTFTITGDVTFYAQWKEIAGVRFTAQEDGSTVGLVQKSSLQTLEYTTDGLTWSGMTTATTITLTNSGDTAIIRGILHGANSLINYTQFKSTGLVNVSGNLNNLWDYTNNGANLQLQNYCGNQLFAACTGMTFTDITLPSTKISAYCYNIMFVGCTRLTTAPELPAITMRTSCYKEMFNGCANLTTAPALNASTLAESCYQGMFYGCTNLTTAPALPATTLAEKCYNEMFRNCTHLTTAPMLPATTLTSSCYRYMFAGCTRLSSITCLAINNISNGTLLWVRDVSSTGTFYKNPNATDWTTGTSGIPSGWTVEDYQE